MDITIEEVGAAAGIAKTHEDGPKPEEQKDDNQKQANAECDPLGSGLGVIPGEVI